MNTLFQAEESSLGRGKRIAVVFAGFGAHRPRIAGRHCDGLARRIRPLAAAFRALDVVSLFPLEDSHG